MKSRALLIGLCILGLCSPRILSAQENWRLGLEATPSYFMMYNKTDWNETYVYPDKQEVFDIKGFSGGIRLSVDLTEYIGITTGLRYVYARQDYKQTGDQAYSFYENYFTTSELQMPLLFTLGTSNRDDFRFYTSLGIGFNYRLSYIETFNNTTVSPFGTSTVNRKYEGSLFSYSNTYGVGSSASIVIDRMYKDFTIVGIAEIGITRTFKNGIGFNAAFQYQCGITNPENRDAKFYDIPEGYEPERLWHTIDGTKWWPEYSAEDVRPQTFPMHFGLLFGVYYQFGY